MSDEIHGHQGAVAVTGDTDAVRVDHTEPHAFIDSGLGIGDELLEVGVVGFPGITDDRERSVVDDGITGEQEKAILAQAGEGFLGADNLAGNRGLGVIERIGIKNGRDPRALLVAGWSVKGEGQVQTVGALVGDEALLDGAHFGSGVWDAGQGDGGGSEDGFAVGRIARWAEGARKGVRRIGWGLMPGEEGFRTGSGEGKETLEAVLIAAEEPFCF